MPQMYPVAGCKIYIGSAAIDDQDDDFDAADFDSVSWTQIKGWTECGSIGDTAQLITSEQISVGRDKKAKGTRNAGAMENAFDLKPTDAGQLALIAAEKTSTNWPIKIEMNDAPSAGSAPTPSERLFIGLVMSATEGRGGANNAQKLNSTIEINSNIVNVAAATGD